MSAVAAVDCGTNSTRLLVADDEGHPLERRMKITRLGEGVDATHALAEGAVARTVAVLRQYREVMDRYGVGPVRMTATSAVRDATNPELFFDAAREAVGVDAELLAGEDEARLSFAGATAELDLADAPWLVADIGGGSTELARGPAGAEVPDRYEPTAARSLDMGCVRVTERFLLHDPSTATELEAAKAWVEEMLGKATAEVPDLASVDSMVGLAGTVSATARLDLRLATYDRSAVHHHQLRATAVASLLDELAALDVEGRRRRPGMEEDRADVIVGGLVILDGLLRHFGVDTCLVSESDILDGLVMSLVHRA